MFIQFEIYYNNFNSNFWQMKEVYNKSYLRPTYMQTI